MGLGNLGLPLLLLVEDAGADEEVVVV